MIPFTHVNLAIFGVLQILRITLPFAPHAYINNPTNMKRLYFISESLSYNAGFSLKALCYLCPKVPQCLIDQHKGTTYEKLIEYTIRDIIGHYMPILWFLVNVYPNRQMKPRLTYAFVSLYIKYIWCVLTTQDSINILDKEHIYNKNATIRISQHIKANHYIKATLIGDLSSFIPYLIHLYAYKKNIK